MSARMLAGVIVGVVAVLVLSLSGTVVQGNSYTSSVSGAHPSVVPSLAPPPNPFVTGMAASVALGAADLSSTWAGPTPNASSFVPDPEISCMAPNGALWVPDYGGNRVTEFLSPFVTGEKASIVLGQTSFSGNLGNTTATGLTNPAACAVDSHGDVWVADDSNSRVLEYVPPFGDGMAANLVIGQSGFTSLTAATTATGLTGPTGVAFDTAGNLWVTDAGNNRVLEYQPPFTTGMAASIVIGQSTFVTKTVGVSAENLSFPFGVTEGGGVLWVDDYNNLRILGFSAPFTMGEGASYVLGQTSFVGSGATGLGSFVSTGSVAVDAHGDLWVSDFNGNRVYEFLPPFTNFESPTIAIGQTTLTGTTFGLTATTLDNPLGAFVAPNGNLWVTDATNGRVLEYTPSVFHVKFAAAGLPASTNLTVTVGGTAFHGPGPNLTVAEMNGSYLWSVAPISGYTLSPASGNFSVNGANFTVSITATQVTYAVTFNALGISSATGWSVTLGGVTHTSATNGSISFTEANGTYAYSV
ncbi:MAG TPA: hypothetical protein VK423_04375, partial [Thermoplasmata archaeon]|nr:hypothetical protein [Thermoplasmata archaeon]